MQISKKLLSVIIITAGLAGGFIGSEQGNAASFDDCEAARIDYGQAMQTYQEQDTPQNAQRQHEAFLIYQGQCSR